MEAYLRKCGEEAAELFEWPIRGKYPPKIDLSVKNVRQTGNRLYEFEALEAYVAERRKKTGNALVWGGYLEHRMIYSSSPLFHVTQHPRNIHLGIDFWTNAGTAVHAPLAGTVHSFQDNAAFRDYGPTIVLQHTMHGRTFHTLYGHLSRASLDGLELGQSIHKGQCIAWLGAPDENGNWPPHLHFQIIVDMQGKKGDYPGVCALEELKAYSTNCPDPRWLLKI
jgi:murein DD-endopeptidase MepM/ murein hydrolase activator NlpD